MLHVHGFTVRQVAAAYDPPLSHEYIARMLAGNRRPRPDLVATIERLAGPDVAREVARLIPSTWSPQNRQLVGARAPGDSP